MVRWGFPLCLLVMLGCACGQQAGQEAAQPAETEPLPLTTLKVGTRVVEISAVVKAKDGEHRGGMAKGDFVLKQDGKEVPIRYFSQGEELPLTLALLVDTSGSQRTFIGDESVASDVFFQSMLEQKEDRAMLVQFDAKLRQLRGLTSSASDLHLALLSLDAHPATANGTVLNDAVFEVAKDVLAKQMGRKAIVILSDGGENGSRRKLSEAIEQAQRADVQVYSILYSAREIAAPASSQAARALEQDSGRITLEALSAATGGHVFTVTHGMSLREIFARISEDLRLEYELGYTPPASTAPNSYHKLELRARDKKLMVQARTGFFAAQ